ncbi:hypothetical protein GCM10009430_04050 [Aquimarina litoralis]|uniref:Outer membrane protein assembly factor BamE, lipoprotein component of the BamABCDE complex n=1 Tax=Aquimarina litoralis TaxID=584605 RepID=A0ABN1IGL4_9FLAO
MKLLLNRIVLCFVFLLIVNAVASQEIPKYDYLEIIVVQKANNSGKVKRIKVQEQKSLEGKQITIKEIEDLEGTSDLLNYMNAANWEFVDRQSVVSEENDPVWMSYIFRKRKY